MGFFGKSKKSKNEILEMPDLEKLRRAVDNAGLPDYGLAVAEKEIERLSKTDPAAPEYAIEIAYLEYLTSLPWNKYTDDNLDLDRAKQTLDSYHYGLESVKERILEFLAVRTLCSMKPFRVLVVDDEAVARTNLEYVLRKEGYEVAVAENGSEALEKLVVGEFDLLLTDLKMEKIDGMQLLERVKKIAPHMETIIFTGYATVSSAVEALQHGAAHYLTKPINLDELREVVKKIRDKKRHIIQNVSGPILCFSGPPGTEKTSVGKAIAEALGRKFTRLSMAGMRDESELRGHRRTYVGAMPGRIINEIKRLGVRNPLFMLDEIDKMGQDFRGDPSSVLLEILDPEQNNYFLDYYLDLPFDLSPVIFIATANSVEDLSAPLRDRMEVITFSGYSEKEKLHIARSHLIPKQLAASGLIPDSPQFSDDAIIKIIREYTEESGVRNLEREIATVCRKLAKARLEGSATRRPTPVGPAEVENLLGPRKYRRQTKYNSDRVGVSTGLVWTDFGGEIIFVETSIMPGAQELILTGSLGSVIKESAQTALSYIRSHARELGIDSDFYAHKDIHIHIPAGDIPKDGPSAGLTIAIALISLLTGRKVRSDVAITGELSLTGRILPVKGVKEKILAAQRATIKTVIFPKENAKDIETLDEEVLEEIQVITVEELLEVIDVALMPLEGER